MPRDNTKFAVVRSSELSAAIQRVAQFADERSGAIRLRLEGNELKISANSTESGESEDTIDTPYSERADHGRLQLRSTSSTSSRRSTTRAKCGWSSRTRSRPARCGPKIPTPSTSTATC